MLDQNGVTDSRDIEEKIDDLESEKECLLEDIENVDTPEEKQEAKEALWEWENDDDGGLLMDKLTALRDDVSSSEWVYGLGLIGESYFTEYVEEMLKDIGDLPSDIPHYIAIDWEETADNIRVDYSEVEYDGETYLFRDC